MATASKASPPKPWERAGAGAASSTSSSVSSLTGSSPGSTPATMSSSNNDSSSSTSSSAPALPARPADMSSSSSTSSSSNALTNSAYGANRYGTTATTGYGATSAYGATGYGGMSSYASPYSRFGGGYGGGYGGYGGGFGGYGGGYGSPYGGYGAGMPGGMAGDMSLTRQMEAGTQATFQLLQSVVSAFGGFAQMLESTYMATHSSFFAMIGVAEQFASLRTWLGEVLSVFTLLRFVKRMLGYGGGGGGENSAQQQGGANGLSAADFNNFSATGRTTPVGAGGGQAGAGGVPGKPKVSKKPIVIFFLTVIGLPWLMNKLVKLITAKQQAEARRLGLPEGAIPPLMDHNGQPLPQHLQPPGVDLSFLNNNPQLIEQQRAQQEASIDPATLTFVRAQYPHTSNDQFELSFNKGDIIAVLTPKEERQDPGWWRGRLRDGSIGWFPSTHVQEIPMNNAQKKLEQQQQQPEGKVTKV